jgi:hypothetical protein
MRKLCGQRVRGLSRITHTLQISGVFENRVLRGIFGPKRNEISGGWRKINNGEFRHLYSSPSIITMSKSRMIWAGMMPE